MREPWDDERLDLSWSEARHIVFGFFAVLLFVVVVTIVASGT